MIPRINLFGGPGVGKSTFAAKLFARMKRKGANVELVKEVVKQWVYEGRQINPWDCVPLFGQQFEAEQQLLQNGVDQIITDSPMFLQCVYSKLVHGCPASNDLIAVCEKYDRTWAPINFFLCRAAGDYDARGRYQQDAAAARVMDERIKTMLEEHSISFHPIVPTSEEDFLFCLNLVETS